MIIDSEKGQFINYIIEMNAEKHNLVWGTMSLYSTGTLTNVQMDKRDIETEGGSASRAGALPQRKERANEAWHYLFVHYKKMDEVRNLLEKQFHTFVHKRILYKRENKQIKKEESPTIANLLFVQGNGIEIQTFLFL